VFICRRLPVLLQGETSVGKTSLVKYLARLTGNICHRINNHEHTDIQEYIGCYTASEHTGRLVFCEGVCYHLSLDLNITTPVYSGIFQAVWQDSQML